MKQKQLVLVGAYGRREEEREEGKDRGNNEKEIEENERERGSEE